MPTVALPLSFDDLVLSSTLVKRPIHYVLIDKEINQMKHAGPTTQVLISFGKMTKVCVILTTNNTYYDIISKANYTYE